MTTEKILNSYTIAQLKKEISKANIKGYSKMKRAELHALIMKNKERFNHLTEQNNKKGKVKKKVDEIEKKVKKQTKPSNKNVPEDISKSISQFVPKSNEMDTKKGEIEIRDTPYLQTKVRELLVKKLGNKPYLKNNKKFTNLIKYIVAISNRLGTNDDRAFGKELFKEGFREGQQLFTHDKKGKRMKTKGAAALFMAKILASPVATIKSGGKKEVFIEYLIKNSTGSIKSYNKLFSVLKTDPDKPKKLIEEIKKKL
jgi:hypothetical protein